MSKRVRDMSGGSWAWSDPGQLPKDQTVSAFKDIGIHIRVPNTQRDSLSDTATMLAKHLRKKAVSRLDPLRIPGTIGFEVSAIEPDTERHNKRRHLFTMVLTDGVVDFTEFPGVTDQQRSEVSAGCTRYFHEREEWLPSVSLTSVLQDSIIRRMGGTKCRRAGGVYFVPPWGVEMLDHLTEELRHPQSMFVLTTESASLFSNERSMETVIRFFNEQIQGAVDEINDEVASLAGSAYERGTKSRLSKLLEMRAKVEQYESFLGVNLDNLKSAIAASEDTVNEAAVAALTL